MSRVSSLGYGMQKQVEDEMEYWVAVKELELSYHNGYIQ